MRSTRILPIALLVLAYACADARNDSAPSGTGVTSSPIVRGHAVNLTDTGAANPEEAPGKSGVLNLRRYYFDDSSGAEQ